MLAKKKKKNEINKTLVLWGYLCKGVELVFVCNEKV